MKKRILLGIIFMVVASVTAQKIQRIGYIDTEYILQNVPAYLQAQNSLDAKVGKWKAKIAKEASEIQSMKMDLSNEKAILTKELIAEREEDISIKEQTLEKLKDLYFGANGELYNLRKVLIQPIQDQVYNAVQTISKRKNLDFVFDKSSDLIMLYANKKYDISNLVIKLIKIDQKYQDRNERMSARQRFLNYDALSDEEKEKIVKRETEKQKILTKKEQKLKKREEQRKARLKALEEKKRKLRERKEAIRKAKLEAKKNKDK